MNDAFGRPQSVVVLGGTSDIARALLTRWSPRCRSLVLAGRDGATLENLADDFRPGIERVHTVLFDATTTDAEKTVARCFEVATEPVDVLVLAVGELGTQQEDEVDPARVARMVTVNFTWPAAALTAAATRLRQQGHGRIVVLSSVAGVRVRRANYVYGAAKYGLDGFAQGLSEALEETGVSLHLVRPGFVRTKMTQGRQPAPLAVDPDRVTADIVRGLERGRPVIWSPAPLKLVLGLLRLAPTRLWRRLPG